MKWRSYYSKTLEICNHELLNSFIWTSHLTTGSQAMLIVVEEKTLEREDELTELIYSLSQMTNILQHLSHLMTKPTKWLCTQQRLRSAWASAWCDQSSMSTWRKLGSLATHTAHSENSDRTGRMPRLIWIFAGCTVILLVLSWGSSFLHLDMSHHVCYILTLMQDVISKRILINLCTINSH